MTQAMQTIYAVALEDDSVGGVEWRFNRVDRDNLLVTGVPGYGLNQLVPFEFEIEVGATNDEITARADELMWGGEFLARKPRMLHVCNECGSPRLMQDAYVPLNDPDNVITFDAVICDDCGVECRYHEVEVPTDFDADTDFFQGDLTWLSTD